MSGVIGGPRGRVSFSERRSSAHYHLVCFLLARVAGREASCAPPQCGQEDLAFLRDKKIDSLYYWHADEGGGSGVQSLYDEVYEVQKTALRSAVMSLAEECGEPIVFKGASLADRFFSGRGLGLSNDCDLLVRECDLAKAKRILFRVGYAQSVYDSKQARLVDQSIGSVAAVEASHYELAPFNKVVELSLGEAGREASSLLRREHPLWVDEAKQHLVVELDVHWNLAADIDVGPLWERAKRDEVSGWLTLSDADHVWLLCSRLYNEVAIHGKRSLRDFAYLAALIARGDVDWGVVRDSCEKYVLHCSLFYYLSFLNRACGPIVPLAEIDWLAAGVHSIQGLRNWGWQLQSLFDVSDPYPFDA